MDEKDERDSETQIASYKNNRRDVSKVQQREYSYMHMSEGN